MDQRTRPVYEPPVARDLSVGGVSGQMSHPYGWCLGGNNPGLCTSGASPAGTCSIGAGVTECSVGSTYSGMFCYLGDNPAHCTNGSRA